LFGLLILLDHVLVAFKVINSAKNVNY